MLDLFQITIWVMLLILILTPYINIHNKKLFYNYFLIVVTSITVPWFYILIELSSCPGRFSEVGFIILGLFFLIPTRMGVRAVIVQINDNLSLNKYEDSLYFYVLKQLKSNVFFKLLKLLIFIYLLFQIFLLDSAHNAYKKAIELKVKDIEKKNMWDFYSPTIKTIYINDDTRWSYHRGVYVNEWD